MYVLVTGGWEMLGWQVVREVSRYQYGERGHVFYPSRAEMDIVNARSVEHWAKKVKPKVTYHCAAMTDVNACTQNPERTYDMNALGTANEGTEQDTDRPREVVMRRHSPMMPTPFRSSSGGRSDGGIKGKPAP
jgi:UDP-glucose 4-epimerase